MHALIVGSSGYVGSRLVAHLAAAGHTVTATARDPDKLNRFDFSDTVQREEMDVTDEQSCRRALERVPHVEVAYYLVHSIGGDDYAEHDLDSAQLFAARARRAGVGRIVYLGGFVPAGEELSEHLESRAEVGEALDSTAVDLVWLRAAVILGAGSTSYELIRYLAERLPIIPLPAFMNHPVAPIAVDDVLRYLAAAGDPAQVPPGHYDISNGQTLTYRDLIKQYAQRRNLRRWWIRSRSYPPPSPPRWYRCSPPSPESSSPTWCKAWETPWTPPTTPSGNWCPTSPAAAPRSTRRSTVLPSATTSPQWGYAELPTLSN